MSASLPGNDCFHRIVSLAYPSGVVFCTKLQLAFVSGFYSYGGSISKGEPFIFLVYLVGLVVSGFPESMVLSLPSQIAASWI
ncbi:unnamed protein product [Cochlearia groenlandica]